MKKSGIAVVDKRLSQLRLTSHDIPPPLRSKGKDNTIPSKCKFRQSPRPQRIGLNLVTRIEQILGYLSATLANNCRMRTTKISFQLEFHYLWLVRSFRWLFFFSWRTRRLKGILTNLSCSREFVSRASIFQVPYKTAHRFGAKINGHSSELSYIQSPNPKRSILSRRAISPWQTLVVKPSASWPLSILTLIPSAIFERESTQCPKMKTLVTIGRRVDVPAH